ncbi:hypothetical protein F5Y14DRAFT_428070 [Nemania sp. NC0429]|nr:hypothetical protein F5Y14DRAFT_428070 [Nemania sp. NC0429]
MAEPPNGYGHYPGHYPPATSFPPMPGPMPGSMPTPMPGLMHAPLSAQPPYYHPSTPQAGAIPPANYAASQSAYDHNAIMIPGLGLGPRPPVPASTPYLPSALPNAPQAWPIQTRNPQTNHYFQSQQKPPASRAQQPNISHRPSSNNLEEGELSEGEFEDLYEPGALSNARAPLKNKPVPSGQNASAGGADESSLYDPNDPRAAPVESAGQTTANSLVGTDHEAHPDDEWEPSYLERERSGSYSPYLSPREVHRKVSITKVVSRDIKNRVEASQAPNPTGKPLPTTSSTSSPMNSITPAFHKTNGNTTPNLTAKQEHRPNGSSSYRSPLEAKKKAQEAILGLWPLKVRYQDYIDEGIDANVVKSLFKDIGLDIPVSKATPALVQATSDAQPTPPKAITPTGGSLQSQSASTPKTPTHSSHANPDKKDDENKTSEIKVVEKSAAEERKDKIARKLAAIAQKTTAAQPPAPSASTPTSGLAPTATAVPVSASAPSPAPVSVPAPAATPAGTKSDAATTPTAAAKTRAENNAILQQKLAALKKQQARLAADKVRVASNAGTGTPSSMTGDPIPVQTSHHSDPTPKPRSAIEQSSKQPNSSAQQQADSKNEGIPGLSFSSAASSESTQGPNRGVKRPVASDFDNYTTRHEPPKRTRTEERLVINVSDDEDVEMEIGSPTDDLPPSADSSTVPARQALGAFPPLADGPTGRPRESPVSSSAPTPPVQGARIDLLRKRIEETKRLIAEAEAKKAAKKATTQLSSRPSSPVVSPDTLSKLDEGNVADKRVMSNRRDRIASYELPRITATLKEKQDRLKLLLAETTRLELEVQASLDEQRKLTTEMDCLVEPGDTTPTDRDQQSPLGNGKYPELEVPLQAESVQPQAVSPQTEQAPAANNREDPDEERSGEPQLSPSQESPSPSSDGGTNNPLNIDEALQAAILTDNTHSMDLQMTDAGMPAPTYDTTPAISKTPTADVAPGSPKTCDPAQPSVTEMERDEEQSLKGTSTNADSEASSMLESAPLATSVPPSESDGDSSDSDVSMQQSAPELSQSDDESYEPTPAQISDSHGAGKEEQTSTEVMKLSPFPSDYPLTKYQVVDDVLEEPSPNHTFPDRKHQEPENTSNEVKNRSYEEPLLLTIAQEVQDYTPPLEDLLSYKSPLSYFRAYRFHPKYFEEVPGGLKSMTFSARIDPMREVCSHVLAGEPCPKGPSCEYQHFDSMVLPDAEIITQLGSSDMFVGETKTKFIEGLKKVLNDLKANKVKDFDRVAQAIVKHRQEFLGDKIKVLALDSSDTQVNS